MRWRWLRVLGVVVVLVTAGMLALPTPARQVAAAEYEGEEIDGESYSASAYSYSTRKYYDVEVEFDGDEITMTFARGGYIILTMDDEEIEDPHDISAYDYKRRVYWDLDVEGLD